MLTTANPFDSKAILDGIRRWVEIETPTEAPEQVNKLATMVEDGYRDLPVTIERIAGHSGCGDHLVLSSSWGQHEPGILVLSLDDTGSSHRIHDATSAVPGWRATSRSVPASTT